MRRLLFLASAALVLSATVAFGQSRTRGTFSASDLAEMEKFSASDKPPTPLTIKTIDVWLAGHNKVLWERLRAAKKGSVSRTFRKNFQWFEESKRFQFRTRQAKEIMIGVLAGEIAIPTLPPLHPFAFRDGEIGPFVKEKGMEYHVLQIIDKETALISVWRGNARTSFFLVSQLVGLALQEGQELNSISGTYMKDGTRKYTTITGAASIIPVLHRYDLRPHLEKLKKK